MSEFITNNNVRIPVTPLSIEHIALAEDKELICDYQQGKLYIKNMDNLYDITSKVKETIEREGFDASKCTVKVDGVGLIYIGNAINHIMNSLINITDVGSEPEQIIAGYQIDYVTITNKDKKLQLAGFRTATDNTVPTKVGDVLKWLPAGGETSIAVYPITIEDSKLQMLAKPVQHTSNLDTWYDVEVHMPEIIPSEYFTFRWRLDTSAFGLDLDFPPNVGFVYETDGIVEAHSTYVFEFETYDHGITWLAKMTRFYQPKYDQTIINAVLPKFYTKEQIEAFLSWIEHTEDEGPAHEEAEVDGGSDLDGGDDPGDTTADAGAAEYEVSGDGADLDDI